MKKYFLFFILIITIGCKTNNNTTNLSVKKILFIGNSLTYYHDMPVLLQKMFDEKNIPFKIEQITHPGFSLDGHLNSIIIGRENSDKIFTRPKKEGEISSTVKKLQANNYDYIILQPKSGLMIIPKMRDEGVLPAIKTFQKLADSSKTKVLLFENFPLNSPYPRRSCKRIGRAYDKACSIEIMNLDTEMNEIKNAIDTINIPFVPVGHYYFKTRKKYPDIQLYEDDIHPNKTGAFLSALSFYHYFSNQNPLQLKFTGELNNKTANILKAMFEEAQ